MEPKDGIGVQQTIRISYHNLLKMRQEKIKKQRKLLFERYRISSQIHGTNIDILNIENEISKLQKICENPEHNSPVGCPDCGHSPE